MNTLRLTARMLRRDLRAGHLNVLVLALVLAVAALTGVGFLAERVQRAVESEAHQLLGGDLLLSADHAWDERFRRAAVEHGLQFAESASFPSMVSAADGVQLAEIKAVSANYPLRGELRIAPQLNAPDRPATGEERTPKSGQVWPDERLAAALALAPGQRLNVGAGETAVAAIVTHEPDRGINPFSLAPRLILPLVDLPATGLVQPGSRITWRLHLAGERANVVQFQRWAKANLGRGERLEALDNARPEIRNLIERAQRFLSLAALLTVVLAAVAVGLAARRYMQTHLDACAVMRCLGASERQILLIHGGEFILLGLMATLLGGALGYGFQHLLQSLLAGLVGTRLPAPGWMPWLHGLAVGTVLVVGFVLPPLLRLKSVPTVRVLRREWGDSAPLSILSYALGLGCLAGLMFWIAGDARLGGVVLGGFMVAIAVFALVGRLLLFAVWRVLGTRATGGWRIGLANLRRRADASLVQVVALALGLTTLLLLTLARGDLLDSWRSNVPVDAPNRFVINIQPDQHPAIADFFTARELTPPRLEPMVRGRLTRVNGRPVAPRDYVDNRAQRLVEREFNLSERNDLPVGNKVIAGHWHAESNGAEFSVEKGLAETLNLHIGDELEFSVVGQSLTARITSLRQLNWDSMRVNFFVIAPQGHLANYPSSYITSFHLPAGKESVISELVRQFPNLTVVDVASLMRQIQETLDQVIGAVQLVFGIALLAGLVVLYAALQASAGERRHELAVLRALGAQGAQLRAALLAEFAALGGVAGLLAGIAATAMATGLARWVFQLDYLPTPDIMLAGIVVGSLGVMGAGLAATRRARGVAVTEGLRET
ncbi:MAG: FtsX-like permease family protein [Rhodocyclaceae bacterium]|nr:FtsX-like permease family protein [Rhodocyclaceae bacterium]MDZ4213484.1 FtsX-like permease family protein [Rhodocyclaceae bacterium]